jgi:hypothetical protein
MKRILILTTMLSMVLSLTVYSHAALIDNYDGTVTQIRNDNSMLMWLKDAKTAWTSGYCDLPESTCNFQGQMTWYEATNWITYLNDNNYLGYNDWRLPEVNPVNGVSYDYGLSYDGSTDVGYNISAPGSAYEGNTASEFAYLYYYELGNLGYYDTSGSGSQSGWGLNDTGPFTNFTDNTWWTGAEYNANAALRFSFYENFPTYNGYQEVIGKGTSLYTWAVRSAGMAPEPISPILFVIGSATLAAWRMRVGRG